MGFRRWHQCFVGTTDGTTDGTTGTYIRPEANKYAAFKNWLWAPTILSVSFKFYLANKRQPEIFTAPYLAKQSYLHRYNWLHVHLCEALCLGT